MKSIFMMLAVMVVALFSAFNAEPAYAAHIGMDVCIKNCGTCASVCDKALKQNKGKLSNELVKALEDCTAICKTSEGMLVRGSSFHPQVCKVCSAICAKCAELCEKSKDKALQECAKECRKCEDSCKKMAS